MGMRMPGPQVITKRGRKGWFVDNDASVCTPVKAIPRALMEDARGGGVEGQAGACSQ